MVKHLCLISSGERFVKVSVKKTGLSLDLNKITSTYDSKQTKITFNFESVNRASPLQLDFPRSAKSIKITLALRS